MMAYLYDNDNIIIAAGLSMYAQCRAQLQFIKCIPAPDL